MSKKKKLCIIIALTLISVAIILSVLYCNSYRFSLKKAGIRETSSIMIDSGINSNGDPYRVVAEYNDGKVYVCYLVQKHPGFWHIEQTNEAKSASAGVEFSWANVAGIRRYSTSESPMLEFENHLFYCSDNAIKRVDFSEGDLPHNVTVNTYQTGNVYMLHFITYDTSGEIFNELDCYSLLKKKGCVQ